MKYYASPLTTANGETSSVGRLVVVKGESGFTIPELLVSMSIAIALVGVVLAINLNFFGSVAQSRITAELAVESHFVLQTMVEDIRLADGIALNSVLTDANEPASGWATSDTNNVLILNSPAIDSSNNIVYDPDTGYPYRNELIYFMNGNKLYKRTLKNPDAPGNTAVTSCPPAQTSSSCPVDKQYTTYISDMTLVFYDASNSNTVNPTVARSTKVGLNMSRLSFGKPIKLNNSIQTTLRNY